MNTGISVTEKMCRDYYVLAVTNDLFDSLSESTFEFTGIGEILS